MKLSDAVEMSLSEASFATTINEAGEGPKLDFDYGSYKNDPHPDILMLGTYKHPNTGNNLVGGINLHYLNDKQRNDLAEALPKIMSGGNLYDRYHLGKDVLPEIFKHFYRTYNSAHVSGVTKGTMYPKYGYMKTAGDWLKKKLGGIFKNKQQRQADLQPKYPDDLKQAQDALDQTVNTLQNQPQAQPQQVEPDAQTIDQIENIPINQMRKDVRNNIAPQGQAPQPAPIQPVKKPAKPSKISSIAPPPRAMPKAVPEAPLPPPKARPQLEPPTNDYDTGDPLDPNRGVAESIIYYSQAVGKYVIDTPPVIY